MKETGGPLDEVTYGSLGALAAWFFIRIVTPHALDAIRRRDEQLEEYRAADRQENEELKLEIRRLNHTIRSLEVKLTVYRTHCGPLPEALENDVQVTE